MRRGRGLQRLFQGVSNGDPFSIVIVMIAAAFVGFRVYRSFQGRRE